MNRFRHHDENFGLIGFRREQAAIPCGQILKLVPRTPRHRERRCFHRDSRHEFTGTLAHFQFRHFGLRRDEAGPLRREASGLGLQECNIALDRGHEVKPRRPTRGKDLGRDEVRDPPL